METKFQTSFIPKKPITPVIGGGSITNTNTKVHHALSVYMVVSILIFTVSLAGLGGAYLWKKYLIGKRETYKAQLVERKKQFNTALIQKLKLANTKIDTAKGLIENHLAFSAVFEIISKLTAENIRFTELSLDFTPEDGIKMNLTGYGSNLSAVAFQASVLSRLESYGLRNIVKNPIMTDPNLEDGDKVTFGFSASIDPANLSYQNLLSEPSDNAMASSTSN